MNVFVARRRDARADMLDIPRLFYAEEVMAVAGAKNPALLSAFARVPRELFLGPGPWRVISEQAPSELRATEDDDPRHIYHNLAVVLDAARGVNNGLPSLWARAIDRLSLSPGERVLHLGCGSGYYSAIMADMVGAAGAVTAVEIDRDLARRAQAALKRWPQAKAVHADGAVFAAAGFDALVVSAGAAFPPRPWFDALKPGGRLLFPLTTDDGFGAMLLARRREGGDAAIESLGAVRFFGFVGLRGDAASARLRQAFEGAPAGEVKSLRRDSHAPEPGCWLHGKGFCLSRRHPADR